jgi:hypothetical protein
MKYFTILFFTIANSLFVINSFGQNNITHTINNSGGYSNNIEWSIGESISIKYFSSSGYTLNTGLLQPTTNLVTGIFENGLLVFGTQITIGPNPTSNLLHIKANFNQVGNLSFQLIDAKSSIVFSEDAGKIFNTYNKNITMENYPSGIFYIKILFKPNNGITKTGIYKIIKL